MGMDVLVARTGDCPISSVLAKLAAAGLSASVMMVDSGLHAPGAPVPDGWRDVRLKTPAGAVTLKRRPDGIAVIVFGNADAALQAAQRTIADAVREA